MFKNFKIRNQWTILSVPCLNGPTHTAALAAKPSMSLLLVHRSRSVICWPTSHMIVLLYPPGFGSLFVALQYEGRGRLIPLSSVVLHAISVSISFDKNIYTGQRLWSDMCTSYVCNSYIPISSCITDSCFERSWFIPRTQHYEVNSGS